MNKPQPFFDDTLLTIGEVAKALRVSTYTIRGWYAQGLFPAPLKVGARFRRWRTSDINNWLAGLESPADETEREEIHADAAVH